MRLTPLRRSGLLASAALAAVASLVLATSAFADEVTTDDPRAQAFSQFIDVNHPDACTVGGLSGNVVLPGELVYTGGDNQQHLNITGLPEDVKVTGMLVKAGDVFNVYLAGKLGEALPWNELRAPVVDGGNLPEIGQWFGCGVAVEQPPASTTTTTTTTTTSESTVTHSSTPTSTSSSEPATPSSSAEVALTTTTTVAPVPVAEVHDLAATGFGSAWMLGLGAALVAAGAALVLVMRRRRV
ncbi:LPXTG cell wall anchor domain-containing protein [Lentzea californiensis]|uniref:LPXTG cell wall anchor domain-containing protein n=1 Tax=Lentzea californiensis TaxID=438851 RepID=UPI00216560A0|nr:LPXTG cell wall anchor domain-containing protein [Lentzea californiensis]MCR3749522.1 LPXTG-motif cell wall anchor domain-containing protein [Lentzea californiensis]